MALQILYALSTVLIKLTSYYVDRLVAVMVIPWHNKLRFILYARRRQRNIDTSAHRRSNWLEAFRIYRVMLIKIACVKQLRAFQTDLLLLRFVMCRLHLNSAVFALQHEL